MIGLRGSLRGGGTGVPNHAAFCAARYSESAASDSDKTLNRIRVIQLSPSRCESAFNHRGTETQRIQVRQQRFRARLAIRLPACVAGRSPWTGTGGRMNKSPTQTFIRPSVLAHAAPLRGASRISRRASVPLCLCGYLRGFVAFVAFVAFVIRRAYAISSCTRSRSASRRYRPFSGL